MFTTTHIILQVYQVSPRLKLLPMLVNHSSSQITKLQFNTSQYVYSHMHAHVANYR
jgi:hypothetical protein